jgi:transcriptional antiterminator RfaH
MRECWYAVRAKPLQEKIALLRLKQQFFQTYYPLIEIEKTRNGKVIREIQGLFPGYLFVHFLLEPQAWRVINSTRGVLRLLSCNEDGRPSSIPDKQIEWLQHQEKAGLFKFSEIKKFKKGDLIKIKNGLSVGQVGRVIRARGERVEFLMKLLNRQVRCIAPQHTLYLVGARTSPYC